MKKNKQYLLIELACAVIILALLAERMLPKFLEAQNNINTSYHIPDENFRKAMAEYMGVSENGYYTKVEARKQSKKKLHLDVSNKNIQSLEGIDYFRDISSLNCSSNHLSKLDLSMMYALLSINASNNQLKEIILAKGYNYLSTLNLSNNQLSTIDLVDALKLNSLDISDNEITFLTVSHLKKLDNLMLPFNKLEKIDLNGCDSLSVLILNSNQIKRIDLSYNLNLSFLILSSNPLESLLLPDTSNLQALVLSYTNIDLSGFDLDYLSTIERIIYTNNELNTSEFLFIKKLEQRIGIAQIVDGIASPGLLYSATMVIDATSPQN